MRVQLLPSNLSDPRRLQPLTTFLINSTVAIDGGSLGYALNTQDQLRVREIIISHSHNDHIASLPIFVAEVFPFLSRPIEVYATREVIESLREHVFNDAIWPDFHTIQLTRGDGPGLCYMEIQAGVPFELSGLKFTPILANHVVPTIALVVQSKRAAVLFTSDTYHTEEMWNVANRLDRLDAVFVDVSYPNDMEELAAASKHLTPQGLNLELGKLNRAVPVYAYHLKPQFRDRVIAEITALGRSDVQIADIGREYVFGSEEAGEARRT
jgi:ribonuclease BN (tRNA processing enzyme)